MNKTLYITDLDGTFLNNKGKVSEYSLNMVNGLIRKGLHFSYATARSFESAKRDMLELNIAEPIVTYNGVFINKHSTGEILLSNYFNEAEIAAIKECLCRAGIYPFVCLLNNGTERNLYYTLNFYMQDYLVAMKNNGDKRFQKAQTIDELYIGNIFYFKVLGKLSDFHQIARELNADGRFTVHISRAVYRGPEAYWCEIMPAYVSKAKALKQLKNIGNYDKIICFGDGGNDIEMFHSADECYAVANAVAELKSIATGIIGDNDNDGVARWLVSKF